MCSYCGCRAIGPIRDLTLEHVEIRNLMGEVRRAVERDDLDAAVEHLTALLPVLTAHDAVEELSIYRSMERVPKQSEKVGTLFDEHDELVGILERAMR
ncbi:MAG: hemerythrin domain-containing protein, partial [Tetrasphaera sp.]|nr:hemerythrin domain-containing protein [Tetrasphaera sp.]